MDKAQYFEYDVLMDRSQCNSDSASLNWKILTFKD